VSAMEPKAKQGGFALVITMLLLGLLVLVVYALSALSRVGTEVSATGVYQMQARQNAQLGLSQAIGDLQRFAGEDDRLTGMAGVTGIPAGAGQAQRNWAVVWDGNGQFLRWLVPGVETAVLPLVNGSDALTVVAAGSLGSDGADREHVRVRLVPVAVSTRERRVVPLGRYAWWVGDEGVKLSAQGADQPHAIDELIGLAPLAPALTARNILSYEQLALVPTSVTSTALAGQLRANLHALGLTHFTPSGLEMIPGRLNLNTTSHRFWRGVAATYNQHKPGDAYTLSPGSFADALVAGFPAADPGAGKRAGGPYPTVDLFLNSAALGDALAAGGGSIDAFGDVMRPMLTVRSETFRVRAYGDAVNPADSSRVEATAWVEAIVQRVKLDPASTEGRFIITYFRWLGPDDI
jgi:hypothetical protein